MGRIGVKGNWKGKVVRGGGKGMRKEQVERGGGKGRHEGKSEKKGRRKQSILRSIAKKQYVIIC